MASPATATLTPLPPFKPDLYERAWASVPHPSLPLVATAHSKAVTVFSLKDFSIHSSLTGGHSRSVRSVAWRPDSSTSPSSPCLVTASFDSTAGLWCWKGAEAPTHRRDDSSPVPHEVRDQDEAADWEFTLVLEGHDSEIKGAAFSPSGQYLATCSRDKSIWIWEDVGATQDEDEWETIAVLSEHDGDVKAVAWCPDTDRSESTHRYSSDCLASASYDNTVRVWREDGDGEWVCVAVLEGHQGTVWGVQWEPIPQRGRHSRLMSFSADATIRIWTLQDDSDTQVSSGHDGQGFRSGLGSIPNTMRTSMKEEWRCTAILPKVHSRDIYAVSWSSTTGRVASTGSDGAIGVYQEQPDSIPPADADTDAEAAMELDGEMMSTPRSTTFPTIWVIVGQIGNAHGPYEVNHVAWCRRFDSGARGEAEEMLISTGDDGVVRPWQVS